ncbi:DUF1302 domain-containing protein [Pseudomonadota bacterium]
MTGLSVSRKQKQYTVLVQIVLAIFGLLPISILAFELGGENWSGSLDTTLSYGASWRVSDHDKEILAPASTTLPNGTNPPGSLGGTAFSVNGDNGNLNYKKGLISNIFRVTGELELEHKDGYGGFVRVTGFYDYENEKGQREKIDLSEDALKLVGSDIELLDAFVWGQTNIAGKALEVRLGDQVVSWGESTFIQNGINVINPIKVSAIRTPSAEIRDALDPVGILWGSMELSDNQSLEGFYQYEWDETEPEPAGSYFSINDFATAGGDTLYLGFGSVPDILPPGPMAASAPVGAVVSRGETQEAGDGGQFGLAYRLFLPSVNDTELGFYFINYHSRLPVISARSGVVGPTVNPQTGQPAGLAVGDYIGSASYFTEYPEDIRLWGASFNTELGGTGVALQGEVSYKQDVPLQIDDAEILYATLSPLALVGSPLGSLLAAINQAAPGGVGFDTYIPGFILRDVVQVQSTATTTIPRVFNSDQLILVGEAAITHIQGMPSKTTLRLDAPGTYTGGNPIITAAGIQPATEPLEYFADATSWGYQIRGRLDYNNALSGANLSPIFAFRHDVSGNTPGPGGNFLEGRMAVSLGLRMTYKSVWSAELNYTNFFGAGRHNLLNDRDFISFNIKYSK